MTFVDEVARNTYLLPSTSPGAVVAEPLPMLDGGLEGVAAFDFIDGVLG